MSVKTCWISVSCSTLACTGVGCDGNNLGGIRLPEQTVPLGTNADWVFRSEVIGAPDTLIAMAGSFMPFAKTRPDRNGKRTAIRGRHWKNAIPAGQTTCVASRSPPIDCFETATSCRNISSRSSASQVSMGTR